jgi:uncharacterized membrane protein
MRETTSPVVLLLLILIVYVILPAIIALTVSEIMRGLGWIKAGQMKLEL